MLYFFNPFKRLNYISVPEIHDFVGISIFLTFWMKSMWKLLNNTDYLIQIEYQFLRFDPIRQPKCNQITFEQPALGDYISQSIEVQHINNNRDLINNSKALHNLMVSVYTLLPDLKSNTPSLRHQEKNIRVIECSPELVQNYGMSSPSLLDLPNHYLCSLQSHAEITFNSFYGSFSMRELELRWMKQSVLYKTLYIKGDQKSQRHLRKFFFPNAVLFNPIHSLHKNIKQQNCLRVITKMFLEQQISTLE